MERESKTDGLSDGERVNKQRAAPSYENKPEDGGGERSGRRTLCLVSAEGYPNRRAESGYYPTPIICCFSFSTPRRMSYPRSRFFLGFRFSPALLVAGIVVAFAITKEKKFPHFSRRVLSLRTECRRCFR